MLLCQDVNDFSLSLQDSKKLWNCNWKKTNSKSLTQISKSSLGLLDYLEIEGEGEGKGEGEGEGMQLLMLLIRSIYFLPYMKNNKLWERSKSDDLKFPY